MWHLWHISHSTLKPVSMVWSCLSHVQHKNTKTVAVRPTTRSHTTCWRPAQEIQGSVACKLQVMQPPRTGQVCLEGGVLQCSECIRGAAHRHGQGSSCRKEGSLSLSLLTAAAFSCLCASHVDGPVDLVSAVQSSTKPSLRFCHITAGQGDILMLQVISWRDGILKSVDY